MGGFVGGYGDVTGIRLRVGWRVVVVVVSGGGVDPVSMFQR